MTATPRALLVWTPLEAEHAFDDHAGCDHGPLWSVAAVPADMHDGDRAVVLRSGPGGGLVGVFEVCEAFELDELGPVAWGVQSLLDSPVGIDALLEDPVLGPLVTRLHEPRALSDEEAAAIGRLVPGDAPPVARPDEPPPPPSVLEEEDAPALLGGAPLVALITDAADMLAETAGAMIDIAFAAGLSQDEIEAVAEGRADIPPPEAVGRRALLGTRGLLQAALGDGISAVAAQVESAVLLAAALEIEEEDVADAFGMEASDELLEMAPPADRTRLLAAIAAAHESGQSAILRLAAGAGVTQEDFDTIEADGIPLEPPDDPSLLEQWVADLPSRERGLLELGRFFESQELILGVVAEQALEVGLDEEAVADALGFELVHDEHDHEH